MTTINCDICESEIPNTKHSIATLPSIKFAPDAEHKFVTDTIKACCQFNTTNFAICEACLLKAFKEAVAKL